MAIEFHCPECGRLLTTSDDRARARAQCPACAEPIIVPGDFVAGFDPAHDDCPFCGATAAPGAVYCHLCGGPLAAAPPRMIYAAYGCRVAAWLVDSTAIVLIHAALNWIRRDDPWTIDNLAILTWLSYHALWIRSPLQASPGKLLLGLRVTGGHGGRLSLPRAVARTLAQIASLLICGVGFIMPLLTERRQALHDVLTDSVVVRAS